MSSCRKNETPGPGYINIRGGVSTRTFFGSTNFNDTSNRAKILDFITLPGQNENSTPYIDDELYSNKIGHEVEGIASDWNWSLSGNTYFWTNTGSHRFISWLTFDADMNLTTNSFFGSAPTLDTPTRKVLSIPAKTFNSSTPQFDFIYSNAAIRSMDDANKNYSSVLLAYKHLFTAFSIGIRNWTPTPVVIKSFQLKNMPDTKSGVTVTFKPEAEGGSVSNAMSVTGTSGNTGDLFFSKSDYNTTLNYGQAIVDLFNSSHTYVTNYMMWPLSSAEIYDANSTTDENGRIFSSADFVLARARTASRSERLERLAPARSGTAVSLQRKLPRAGRARAGHPLSAPSALVTRRSISQRSAWRVPARLRARSRMRRVE
ncbi:MAG TPA: hypothetical protein PLU97_03900 [Candidatus Cryptobacteroides sp.]|nr:hypothetical protein [Candidatus Cryptobacteroides sp.]